MFVRIVETRSGGKTHRYLRIVENYRDDGKIKQRVLWNLGNLDKIRNKLPGLVKSLANHSGEKFVALKALKTETVREYGNMLLLETLWNRLDIEEIFGKDKTIERMRPYLMAVTFHHLLNPGGQPPLAEWLGRVYLPELDGPSRSGGVRFAERALGLLKRLEEDGKGKGLRIISKTAYKRTAAFCYIIRLRMNAPGVRGNLLRQKESLLVILATGGIPWAYGIYDGKSPITLVRDVLGDNGLLKRRKITFVTNRQTIGDSVTNFFNRKGIPYIVFINRWSKKAVKRSVYNIGRGYVAHRIKTSGKKGPRVYVLSRKTTRSRKKRHIELAFKTNVADRAFPLKAVKVRRELLHLKEFFGNITAPTRVLSRVAYKRGYILICLSSYLLSRALAKGLARVRMRHGFTYLEFLDRLRDIKVVTNIVSGRRLKYVTKIPRQTGGLLRAFGVKNPQGSLHFPGNCGIL